MIIVIYCTSAVSPAPSFCFCIHAFFNLTPCQSTSLSSSFKTVSFFKYFPRAGVSGLLTSSLDMSILALLNMLDFPAKYYEKHTCHLARTRFSYHLIILHASHPSFHDNATNLTISTHPSNLVQGLVTCRQCFFKNTRELVDFSPKNLKTIIINKFVSFHLSLELTQIQPRPSHPSQVRDSHQNMDPIANLKTPLLELPHSPHINDKSAHPLNP